MLLTAISFGKRKQPLSITARSLSEATQKFATIQNIYPKLQGHFSVNPRTFCIEALNESGQRLQRKMFGNKKFQNLCKDFGPASLEALYLSLIPKKEVVPQRSLRQAVNGQMTQRNIQTLKQEASKRSIDPQGLQQAIILNTPNQFSMESLAKTGFFPGVVSLEEVYDLIKEEAAKNIPSDCVHALAGESDDEYLKRLASWSRPAIEEEQEQTVAQQYDINLTSLKKILSP